MNKPNIERLVRAYQIIGGIPEDRFDLTAVYSHPTPRDKDGRGTLGCNTIACAMGWLALHPEFQQLGLAPGMRGGIKLDGFELGGFAASNYALVASHLFDLPGGMRDGVDLFGTVGHSVFDGRLFGRITDKERFLARMRIYLQRHGYVSKEA